MVVAGIASRLAHTGNSLLDKYLGDALYACTLYVLVSLFWRAAVFQRATLAMALVTAIELFQITGIPAAMYAHGNTGVRLMARLIGTEFSFRDIVAYAVGIAAIGILDGRSTSPPGLTS